MALASQTMPTSATVSTAQSHGEEGKIDASEASSMAALADSVADSAALDASQASLALVDASEASSMASLTESKAVLSEPGSGEYPVKEIVMDTSLDMIVTYDDSSIA